MTSTGNNLIPEKKRRKRKVSAAVVHALELLASGREITICAAAKAAGVTPEWLGKMLKRPEIGVMIDEMSRQNLRSGKLRASSRLLQLLDHNSGRVSLEASRLVLGIGGIAPPQQGVSINLDINTPVGYVIDLSGGDSAPPRMIDITPNTEHPSAEPLDQPRATSVGYGR